MEGSGEGIWQGENVQSVRRDPGSGHVHIAKGLLGSATWNHFETERNICLRGDSKPVLADVVLTNGMS